MIYGLMAEYQNFWNKMNNENWLVTSNFSWIDENDKNIYVN